MTDQPTVKNGSKYLGVLFAIGGWLLGAGMQWGIAKTQEADIERRVTEQSQEIRDLQQQIREETVPRKEFEGWQREIRDRLDAIEEKRIKGRP